MYVSHMLCFLYFEDNYVEGEYTSQLVESMEVDTDSEESEVDEQL